MSNYKYQKPELDKSSMSLFLHLFYQRTIALETFKSRNMQLSKELSVKTLQDRILRFIKEHSYSYFDIRVVSVRDNFDPDKPVTGILVKNFEVYLNDEEFSHPRRYMIVINPNWSEANFYQLSLSGLRIEELMP